MIGPDTHVSTDAYQHRQSNDPAGGWIQPAQFTWKSPVFKLSKLYAQSHDWRMVIDYRALNQLSDADDSLPTELTMCPRGANDSVQDAAPASQ